MSKQIGPIINKALGSWFAILVIVTIPRLAWGDCPVTPTTLNNGVIEERVTCAGAEGGNSAVGVGGARDILIRRFDADGEALEEPTYLTQTSQNNDGHHDVSIDVAADGFIAVGWLGRPMGVSLIFDTVHGASFAFDTSITNPPGASSSSHNDFEVSVGTSVESTLVVGSTWCSRSLSGDNFAGLGYAVPGTGILDIRTCSGSLSSFTCRLDRWLSNMAMQSGGNFVIAWADAEAPAEEFSFFDIKLQAYAFDGTPVGNEIRVNDSAIEVDPSDQDSPAIAIDDNGNIVIAWVGPALVNCSQGPLFRLYARRLSWDGFTTPQFVDGPIRVDNDNTVEIESAAIANPAVAISNTDDSTQCGKFIIAWNASVLGTTPLRREIRAQHFFHDGRPVGQEFRVNQDTSETESGTANIRRLSDSGQHAIDYGVDGQVVVTWTSYKINGDPIDVFYTLIPETFAMDNSLSASCAKGDVNYDTYLDGRDVQPFVNRLIGIDDECVTITDICVADMDCDAQLTLHDAPGFVDVLLGGTPCSWFSPCVETIGVTVGDCNSNEIADPSEIYYCDPNFDPGKCDCNTNGIPDECDIADETSTDIDGDGRPDECEVDCNDNSIPDDYEIEELMVDDCDENGVPDECDFDCDGNEIPDACETADPDCNENGIIDACEDDCDESGVPDDCEMEGNDCNANGRLDSCDIDDGPPFGSLDADENGIPDECEEEMMGGGGESMLSGGSCDTSFMPDDYSVLSNELYAAWEAFTHWCMQEEWGPDSEFSGAEQLERLIEKKEELGICDGGLNEQ